MATTWRYTRKNFHTATNSYLIGTISKVSKNLLGMEPQIASIMGVGCGFLIFRCQGFHSDMHAPRSINDVIYRASCSHPNSEPSNDPPWFIIFEVNSATIGLRLWPIIFILLFRHGCSRLRYRVHHQLCRWPSEALCWTGSCRSRRRCRRRPFQCGYFDVWWWEAIANKLHQAGDKIAAAGRGVGGTINGYSTGVGNSISGVAKSIPVRPLVTSIGR